MSLSRGMDGSDPIRIEPLVRVAGPEERRLRRDGRLGTGTLACPGCDAPVSPGDAPVRPVDLIACPYCGHGGTVREFLSLAAPARPARVAVRVVRRAA
jgi:hypothetical protein